MSEGGSSSDGETRDTKRDRVAHHRQSPTSSRSGSDDAEDDLDGLDHWGTSKRDYYNQDDIEDEADALEEEQEAKRLQQKRLEGMSAADFGLDDTEWLNSGNAQDGKASDIDADDQVVTEVLPQIQITDSMGVDEKMGLLNRGYPEFGPLSKEFLALQSLYATLRPPGTVDSTTMEHNASSQINSTAQASDSQSLDSLPISRLKYQALSAYLGALSMYFALLTSTSDAGEGSRTARPPSDLRDHAIMENLFACRQLWERLKDVRIPDPPQGFKRQFKMQKVTGHGDTKKKEADIKSKKDPLISKRASQQDRAREAREAIQSESARRQAERLKQMEEDLDRITATTKRSGVVGTHEARNTANGDSDLGEEDVLDASEAAEKARKKKSLRFYTSQITQKASRRGQAGKDAGGDTDLPYRERLKDRQARLNEQAEKRGKREVKDDTTANLGIVSDEENHQSEKVKEKGIDSDEEYYQLIASNSRKRKLASAQKASSFDAVSGQGGTGKAVEEVVGPDGKRAISYAIEKNKGLAPKRNKDVRNPRVKKRKKYAEKQKKLSSIRQVYKGGEQRGGYGGEATGIKARLVKSVKL